MSRATQLADHVRDGDTLLVGTGVAEPTRLVAELIALVAVGGLAITVVHVPVPGPETLARSAVTPRPRLRMPVAGRHGREAIKSGRAELLASSMFELHRAIARGDLRIDGVLLSGAVDGDRVVPVLAADLLPVSLAGARFVAVEERPAFPAGRTEVELAIEHVAYRTASTGVPMEVAVPVTETSARIGRSVAELVPDGATVEVGLGASLSAIGDEIVAAGKRVRVHGGLLSDWVLPLVAAGAILPVEGCGAAPIVTAVAAGSARFYEWLVQYPDQVVLAGSAHAHNPRHLGELADFTAVNSASYVDLAGAAGDFDVDPVTAGAGGLLDFSTAAAATGRSIVALASVDRRGRSRIVARVPARTLGRERVSFVVTEWGVADLRDADPSAVAQRLIAIAHPDHRDELRRGPAQ